MGFSQGSERANISHTCRYYCAWGCEFRRRAGLSFISYLYFAAGHGKGICDSEGGHVKGKLSKALLAGENLRTSQELYEYLLQNGTDVSHRTCGECNTF